MFNHSKARQKSQNDASMLTEEQFGGVTGTGNRKPDLLCGYLFNENENKIYGFSGRYIGDKIEISKNEINVGDDGILHWSAFLVQMQRQCQHPTPYTDLLNSVGVPGFNDADQKPLTAEMPPGPEAFNFSRSSTSQPDDVFIKAYGRGAVSEVSVDFDDDDLVIYTKTMVFNGRTHVRQDGLTNYVVNAVRDLINRSADRIVAILESKVREGKGTTESPVFPWTQNSHKTH